MRESGYSQSSLSDLATILLNQVAWDPRTSQDERKGLATRNLTHGGEAGEIWARTMHFPHKSYTPYHKRPGQGF